MEEGLDLSFVRLLMMMMMMYAHNKGCVRLKNYIYFIDVCLTLVTHTSALRGLPAYVAQSTSLRCRCCLAQGVGGCLKGCHVRRVIFES